MKLRNYVHYLLGNSAMRFQSVNRSRLAFYPRGGWELHLLIVSTYNYKLTLINGLRMS